MNIIIKSIIIIIILPVYILADGFYYAYDFNYSNEKNKIQTLIDETESSGIDRSMNFYINNKVYRRNILNNIFITITEYNGVIYPYKAIASIDVKDQGRDTHDIYVDRVVQSYTRNYIFDRSTLGWRKESESSGLKYTQTIMITLLVLSLVLNLFFIFNYLNIKNDFRKLIEINKEYDEEGTSDVPPAGESIIPNEDESKDKKAEGG